MISGGPVTRMALRVLRARIVWMWLTGMSAREISLYTGASVSTVYRWVHRWNEERTLEERPNRGRPRKKVMKNNHVNKFVLRSHHTSFSYGCPSYGNSRPPNFRIVPMYQGLYIA